MKKAVFIISILVFIILNFNACRKHECPPVPEKTSATSSPTILTLQPDAAIGKDATIWYIQSQTTPQGVTNTLNFGSDMELPSMAWTFDGWPGYKQSLIQFDLSTVPASAIITSAQLTLYDCTGCVDDNLGEEGGLMGDSNKAIIQRITSAWQENTVTWDSKPSVTTQNQVIIPSDTSFPIKTTVIDVTSLVQDMVANPTSSFGFLFSQQVASPDRSMVFASSDHSNAALHPKLMVQYNK